MYNEYVNDMMKRYVYDVVRRLPKNQREDIEDVLIDLGDSSSMARRYRGDERHLIGGEYYEQYCYILKIVLICAGAGLLISNIASFFIHSISADGIFSGSFEGAWDIVMIPSVLIQIFAWITISFALIERFNFKVDLEKESWVPNKLPVIPNEKALIRRGDSIVSIVFGVLCIILFTFAPRLMGAWINVNGEMYSIPIFNLEIWTAVLPLFVLCTILGIIRDYVQLINGRYNKRVAITSVITNALGLMITIIIFKVFDVWNPNFLSEVESVTNLSLNGSLDFLTTWNTTLFNNMLLGVITIIYTIDSVIAVYYAVRYKIIL